MKLLKFKIVLFCLMATTVFAQQKLSKVSKSINADKDVTIDLNTSYVEIEIETWNKDLVEIDAYIESSKLSKAELQKALDNWSLEVNGSGDYISVSSKGANSLVLRGEGDYSDILRDLEIRLADMPEIPELPEMPVMPNMADFPELPELPEMPEFPELPELPEGVNAIKFDYDEYKKDGEAYLERWSKEYEEKHGKAFREKMKEWGRKFGESGYQRKMEEWGEAYGKKFEGKWAKDMEKWGEEFGEEFGKKMEKWGKEFEKTWGKDFEKRMEAWGERFGKQMEQQARQLERQAERQEAMAKRQAELAEYHAERAKERKERREEMLVRRLESRGNTKVKKVIKIKMPKKANLKMNVRHGELKFSSVIYNLKGDISHSSLVAEHIDGRDTSINVSYSPVLINDWNVGELKLKYVDEAQITNVNKLMLSSNSSNITINNLTGNAVIDGSFGDLAIAKIAHTFKNLNLTLENSDAIVNLPKTEYSLLFRGERSRFNDKITSNKIINNYPEGSDTSKTIVVNAKYSSVIMQ